MVRLPVGIHAALIRNDGARRLSNRVSGAGRRLVALAATAVLLAGAAGCGPQGPRLVVPGSENEGSAWIGMSGVSALQPRFYRAMSLCVDQDPGAVEVTDVTVSGGIGGVSVQTWAVQPRPLGMVAGSGFGTLAEQGFDLSNHTIDISCGKDFAELGVQVVMDAGRTKASTDAFVVHYQSGGRQLTAEIRLGVKLNMKQD